MRKVEVLVNPKIGKFLEKTVKRINVLWGGAGSGKSYTIAQHLILKKLYKEKDKRILVVRKTLPALRITAYQLVLDLLEQYGLPYNLNKSEMTILIKDNRMLFKSLDDPEKIKSYEGNYLWIEEATEISHKDFMQLNLRLRRHTDGINQMFLSFNPINQFHWINQELLSKPQNDMAVNHTTYEDNPFLSQEYIDELTALKDQDQTFWEVYTLGQWGVLKNIIYTNYKLIDKFPESFDEIIYGLDFGYNNPSSLIFVGIKDEEYYLKEFLYQSGLTNEDLMSKLKEIDFGKAEIYGDSEAPERIEEIARAGFNVYPSAKGKGSVKDGIDFIKRKKLFVHKDSTNLIKELQSYKYKEDKDGNVLEEPVKFRDHACDSFRYAIWSYEKKRRDAPLDEIVFVDL